MNCTPGDLAMVVRNTSGLRCVANVIGSPVRLTGLHATDLFGHGPAWHYLPALRCPNCHRVLLSLLDADLQPLRPKSSEDETVADIIAEESGAAHA